MRVTSNMVSNSLKRSISSNLGQLAKVEEQIASGQKILKPSDDPVGLYKSLKYRTQIAENDQYLSNVKEAISYEDTVDTALGELGDILQNMRDLTVQAANGTNDELERTAINEEIAALKEQIKVIANSTYGGKYIFAGTNSNTAPCGESEWLGNNKSIEVEISIGVTIELNIDMTGFFGSPSGVDELGDADGGIFAVIDDLMSDIASGDTDAISADLAGVDDKINDLLNKRATVGARTNRMELQQSRLKTMNLTLTGLMSDNMDTDITEAAVTLTTMENVFNASLSVGSKIIQVSLVDFIS